jgi:hypothetical protein
MTSIRVLDSDLDLVHATRYDVCLFASGFEDRCVHIPNLVLDESVDGLLVFGFTEEAKCAARARNDAFFLERWKCTPIPLSGNDEEPIFQHLRTRTKSVDGTVHVLVDYSSMSRLWYTAVLNWARFAAAGKRSVVIDFVYSVGKYEVEHPPFVIRGMVSIPGCEGRAYRLRESVAVFGLGFHGAAALCVLDNLEADTVYLFLASPGSSDEYVQRARTLNKDLIENQKTKAIFELPLDSVESSYRTLAEVIAPHRPDGEITLIPMGPKPHVLASILVAMRFPEVACLRVAGTSNRGNVTPTGDLIVTRVVVGGEPFGNIHKVLIH